MVVALPNKLNWVGWRATLQPSFRYWVIEFSRLFVRRADTVWITSALVAERTHVKHAPASMNRFVRIISRVSRSAFASPISAYEESRVSLRVGLLEADYAFAHQAQAPLRMPEGPLIRVALGCNPEGRVRLEVCGVNPAPA